MGCGGSRPEVPAPAAEPTLPGYATPPLPTGHHLLVGLAKALELEHGPANEVGAVSTWVTLELEARPSSHLTDLGTALQPCVDFVAVVEAAVKDKTVSVNDLRELWGCPPTEPKRPLPSGPVALSDVVMSGNSADSWRLKVDAPHAPREFKTSATDKDGSPDDTSMAHERDLDDDMDDDLDRMDDEPNHDGLAGGDGRYS